MPRAPIDTFPNLLQTLAPNRYTRDEERRLRAAVRKGDEVVCPRCGGALERRAVPPRGDVSYVRDRLWFVCGSCATSLVVDRPRDS